ncbi:ATP-grasp domain-containing protein [Streptomyces yunnanensis]|uniref:ATP-grasp domain-containing protein n=1 Tax=Streptomyces yunnanensis TaxID=156453 RepID=A0A9X8MPR9_9ACTN|nr:ATP-grasp domain-containing protein [Streptomyces yunnanensis]SHL36154.1 ATP-grasp domain-containing protein [Streptomyces yunnanensis]
MPHNRPVVVLVDSYTSGKYLPPEFSALGADLVHVQSTSEFMSSMPTPDLSPYRAALVHEDIDKTLAQLEEYAPLCVMAGQEPGVLLADRLAERLGLPTNGTAQSEARRDKYRMGEALRAAGLHCADQFKSGDPAALVAWAEHRGEYPVVVKPLNSAASDGVYICRDAEEVRATALRIREARTIYGDTNTEVLVQSYLQGPEYVVDMVSYAGQRYVCGVWEYHKRLLPGGRNIYDREHLLGADEGPAPELIAYVEQALDALGVRFGPTHAEVIVTPHGPALVEVGTRIAGNMHPGFHDRCTGGNQATLTALAYLAPGQFIGTYAGRRYAKRREAVCCTTSTTLSGVVDAIDQNAVDELAVLPTVDRFDMKIAPGGVIRPTVDLYSSTLRIFMSGASMADIDRDHQQIEQIKDRVYLIREQEDE